MSIADNIARIHSRIADACARSGRPRESVRLMAVSKTHPAASILEARSAGIHLFGENRVQEYASKRESLAAAAFFNAPQPARVHCIGPLQSNKAARAVELFDAIDTLDSLRLAERLNQAAAALHKQMPVCVEIKLSPEPTKHGLAPHAPELDQLFERLPDLQNLQVRGLMTVPPYADDPELARPCFRQLRQLRESLSRRNPRLQLDELSMGMSHDFSVAIEEGATLVRVGTAIFGPRIAGIPRQE